jgi:hypothetical protein
MTMAQPTICSNLVSQPRVVDALIQEAVHGMPRVFQDALAYRTSRFLHGLYEIEESDELARLALHAFSPKPNRSNKTSANHHPNSDPAM